MAFSDSVWQDCPDTGRSTGAYIIFYQGGCSSPRKDKNSKPPTGENVAPREQTIKVNPNGGKQGNIPVKEYLGITNTKSDPNRCQTELVPRRPRENSIEDPSGSNSEAPAKAKRNLQKGISFEFHALVRSERAPKGNKFLGAWRIVLLCRVQFLRRAELEQKENHSEALAREFCSSGINLT